jgi:hypothetical protein
MFDLHPNSTLNELVNHCYLCHELKILTVKLDQKTYTQISSVGGNYFIKGRYLGIKFTIKDQP